MNETETELLKLKAHVAAAWLALGIEPAKAPHPMALSQQINLELKRRETVGRARLLLALLKKFENNPKISVTIRNVARE